jgi:hypothetical protein
MMRFGSRKGRVPPNANHLEGRTYGQWLVVAQHGSGYGNGERTWRCESQTLPGVVRIMTAGMLRRARRTWEARHSPPAPSSCEPDAQTQPLSTDGHT